MEDNQIGGDVTIFVSGQPAPLRQIITSYLHALDTECSRVKLIVDDAPDEQHQPRLQHIYVDLHTKTAPTWGQFVQRLGLPDELRNAEPPYPLRNNATHWRGPLLRLDGEQQRAVAEQLGVTPTALHAALVNESVLEVAQTVRRFVLLGNPGGGKSTLTQRLAGVLASTVRPRDEAEERWLAELTQVYGRWLLPVRIVLSRWAKELAVDAKGTKDDLLAECVRRIGDSATVPGLKDYLIEQLSGASPTVLLLLDGLDEVTDEVKRSLLLKALRHFLDSYPNAPLLLTCRSRPWEVWNQTWRNDEKVLPSAVYTLDRLTDESIALFLQRWHAELIRALIYESPIADQARDRLLAAIHDTQRPELGEMAGTPLLLTMMARVNYKKGLPGSRAALYEEYVNELLWEWEKRKKNDLGEESSLQMLLRAGAVREEGSLNRALSRLAYEVHDRRATSLERDSIDIPGYDLRLAFERICPGTPDQKAAWAVRVLALLDDRGGLINCVDNRDPDQKIYQFSHRTFQEYLAARWLTMDGYVNKFKAKIDSEAWREAIFLALGYQISVREDYHNALTVLDELLSEDEQQRLRGHQPWWRRVLLLGEAYVRLLGEQKASEVEQRALAKRVTQRIPILLTAAMQNSSMSARLRLEAGLLLTRGVNDPPGVGLDEDPSGLDDFVGAPGWDFKIGRYPVTNKQFKRFVDAGGYDDKQWWSKDGWKYRQQQAWTEPRFWNDPTCNRNSQPVVGVSWYEAEAYCAWLTDALRKAKIIQPNEKVWLPTEQQWLTAAHAEGHAYPWGDDFDSAKANTKESNLGPTTPIHMYKDSATDEGVWDLSGNVWEWSADWNEDKYPWLKGGAYYWDKDSALSSSRNGRLPFGGLDAYGFRCVVVPLTRG